MVNNPKLLYEVLTWSMILIRIAYGSTFIKPAPEEGSTQHIIEKSIIDYTVSTDSFKWAADIASDISFRRATVENSCACGSTFTWIDNKSTIYLIKTGPTYYTINGFTDPHALCCNPQCTFFYFISVDHVYRCNVATRKCEKIFSAPGIGSGGTRILSNEKYVAVSCRQDSLNVIYIIDNQTMKSRRCFQTSDPISNLEVNDIGLFFYSAGRLYRYLLK